MVCPIKLTRNLCLSTKHKLKSPFLELWLMILKLSTICLRHKICKAQRWEPHPLLDSMRQASTADQAKITILFSSHQESRRPVRWASRKWCTKMKLKTRPWNSQVCTIIKRSNQLLKALSSWVSVIICLEDPHLETTNPSSIWFTEETNLWEAHLRRIEPLMTTEVLRSLWTRITIWGNLCQVKKKSQDWQSFRTSRKSIESWPQISWRTSNLRTSSRKEFLKRFLRRRKQMSRSPPIWPVWWEKCIHQGASIVL